MLGRETRAVLLLSVGTIVALGCESQLAPPSFAASAFVMTGIQGSGGMGSGTPTYYGKDRQVFTLDVGIAGGLAYGTLDYVDSGFVKSDGNYPHFVVGPDWLGTAITSFIQRSDACADFQGVGYLINTGEQLAFNVGACDHGSPGAGVDTFAIEVPQRLITNGNVYRAGPLPLVYGDLTASGTTAATIP